MQTPVVCCRGLVDRSAARLCDVRRLRIRSVSHLSRLLVASLSTSSPASGQCAFLSACALAAGDAASVVAVVGICVGCLLLCCGAVLVVGRRVACHRRAAPVTRELMSLPSKPQPLDAHAGVASTTSPVALQEVVGIPVVVVGVHPSAGHWNQVYAPAAGHHPPPVPVRPYP